MTADGRPDVTRRLGQLAAEAAALAGKTRDLRQRAEFVLDVDRVALALAVASANACAASLRLLEERVLAARRGRP
jgi:hypothetical protein